MMIMRVIGPLLWILKNDVRVRQTSGGEKKTVHEVDLWYTVLKGRYSAGVYQRVNDAAKLSS